MLPTQFPSQAVPAIMKSVIAGKFDPQAVLGVYEIVGFGLYQYYGDIKYLMLSADETEGHIANLLNQAPEEIQKFMDFANSNPEIIKSQLPPWVIPFAQQAAQWLIAKIFERIAQKSNPTVLGVQFKTQAPSTIK